MLSLMLHFRESVQIPRIEYERLLADRIGARSQCKATMRVMEVIGGTNRNHIDFLSDPSHLVDVAIEPLELDEEACIRKIAIENADRIVWVEGNLQLAPHSFDSTHMPWCNIASGA